MASQERVNITSPVGRVVAGNFYKPNTTDFDGKPLIIKTGPNAGQPRVSYFFALAIPKNPGETHWAQTAWGSKIWQVGHTAFPQAAQRPDFAWKIEDGDSQNPNKKNRKPCDQEGYPGHWILKLSGGFAPKIYRQDGGGYVQVTEEGYLKPGYYVEAAFTVDGNANQSNPGVYLNHSMVCFRAYGPEITFGPDVNEAGFGAAPLPAGASLTPPPSSLPMPAAPASGAPPAPPAAFPAPPPVPVIPQPQFLQMPAPPAVPQMPAGYPVPASIPPANYPPVAGNAAGYSTPMPPASPVAPPVATASPFKMTAKANGASREAFLAAGWTDAQLIQQGIMAL